MSRKALAFRSTTVCALLLAVLAGCGATGESYTGYGMAYKERYGLLFVETEESASERGSRYRETIWLRNLGESDVGRRLRVTLRSGVDDSYPARSSASGKKALNSREERDKLRLALRYLAERQPEALYRLNRLSETSDGAWRMELEKLMPPDDGDVPVTLEVQGRRVAELESTNASARK